ncbi:major capsid protein [Microviridae sp.]|nr:major capsid protein [Microviridae sp.]
MTKSVMKRSFGRTPEANINRSSFDRSHGYKTVFDAGYLIPIYVDETLPGDTFNLNMNAFARLATPIHPIMDNIFLDSFFFAIPKRLVWDNWQKFNGEQDNPGDSTDFVIPKMTSPAGGYAEQSVHDYLGLPTKVPGLEHSALIHRAMNLTWNTWFRDENLQDSLTVNKGDGPDDPADYTLLKRGKRPDYFTQSLPWPQKGDSVSLPLGTSAPVLGIGTVSQVYNAPDANVYETDGSGTTTYADWVGMEETASNHVLMEMDPNSSGYPNVRADLTNATAATINQLRQAFAAQELFERDARGGSRYVEIIKSHFGVTSPDQRLQRPEFLGGGSTPISISQIAQTSSTDATTPQGNLSAFGLAGMQGHGFTKSFTEHCIIIGFVSARADLTYQQGLDKMWSRSTRLDHYWPTFAHIGEQAVLNKEIYAQGSGDLAADAAVFGYQERHAEYRSKNSKVTGLFRSNATASLDAWHLSQEFTSLPALNSAFIEETPPLDRCIAVPSEPHFIFDSYIGLRCARPMPMYGIPGFGRTL